MGVPVVAFVLIENLLLRPPMHRFQREECRCKSVVAARNVADGKLACNGSVHRRIAIFQLNE